MYLDKLMVRLHEAELYFSSKYPEIITEAKDQFFSDNASEEQVSATLDRLPSKDVLLKDLMEKLKGKPVYESIKKILTSKKVDNVLELKGMFSLGTHIIIECEKGNKEYASLLPFILERLTDLVCNFV